MSMTLETIRAAHARIAPYIVRTPLLRLPALDNALGCEVYVKAECMQRTGAFKLRGAMNKILTLTDAERARGFVAASSGNHGRAVAYAAQRFGTHACIVMPETAPAVKQAAIRALGAELVLCEASGQYRGRCARAPPGWSPMSYSWGNAPFRFFYCNAYRAGCKTKSERRGA